VHCRPRSRPRRCARSLAGVAAALALTLASGCVHIKGTAEQPAVFSLRIEGLKHLDPDELAERLATHESDRSPPIPIIGPLIHQVAGARQELGKLEKPPPIPIVGPLAYALRGSGKSEMVSLLDPDQLAVDRRRVEAWCRDRGYYDARVTDVKVTPVGPGQVDVVFQVEEGAPVRVTGIEIVGLEDAPEAQKVLPKPALREGDIFTVAAYDARKDQLTAALQNSGWATAEVTQAAHVLPEAHEVTVKYEVKPGPRYRFGAIFVAGAGSVPRSRIRERAGEEIKPGAWYDQSKLGAAQGRVFNLGVFGGVRVNRGTPDPDRGIIPVVVAVHEAPFRSVRVGPTVGIVSSTRVDASGLVGWTHRNFLGDLRKLDLSLTAGYAWLLAERRGGFIGTATAALTQPGAIGPNVDLGIRLEAQRGLEQGFNFWAQRGRVLLPVHLGKRVTFVPSYSLEVYELELEQGGSLPNANDPDHPLPNPLLASCERGVCLLSYLEQRIELDARDNPLDARRGFYLALAVQEGNRVGGHGYRYLRFLPEARVYIPLGERSVVAARARAGAFVPVNESRDPPTVALFEAGGPSSMRGYAQNRLSPMTPTCRQIQDPDHPDDPTAKVTRCGSPWVPTGGNGLVEYSVEARFPLRGNLFGAIFVDAAFVSYRSAVPSAFTYVFDPRRLQWAAGFGIRYRTPVGPLRLDLAGRLPTDLSRDTQLGDRFPPVPRSAPSVPSIHREPMLSLQLSVGEAF
jgi:translocation and assembly module TamA